MPKVDIKGSRAITKVKYDAKTSILTITMRDGTETSYHGVPPFEYENLVKAKSVGAYFNSNIRGVYPFS